MDDPFLEYLNALIENAERAHKNIPSASTRSRIDTAREIRRVYFQMLPNHETVCRASRYEQVVKYASALELEFKAGMERIYAEDDISPEDVPPALRERFGLA